MSSILKALKKLEDEKTARRPDSLNIDAEILRGNGSRRMSLPAICLVAIIVFVCGGGAMYVYMRPATGTIAGQQTAASGQPQSESHSPSPALPAAPVTAQKPINAGSAEKTVLPPQAVENKEQPKTDLPKPSPTVSLASPAKPRPVQPIMPSKTKQVVAVPAIQAIKPPEQHPAAPSLKVNGIAYQDGGDSVAVVNGVSVSIGSIVDGARVEEIRREMVRFSYGGEKIEVALGKSNR